MLKTALINGSPKGEKSNSQHIIEELKVELEEYCECTEFPMHTERIADPYELLSCPVWVFVFPVHMDAVPSHLLRCLKQLEEILIKEQLSVTVYVVAQCGFYEAEKNRLAMEMMENWCARCYLRWGMSVGIGAGGMLTMLDQKHNYGMLDVEDMLGVLAECIIEQKNAPTQYVEPNLPKKMYQVAAEMSMHRQAKANGLTKEDLKRTKED